MHGLQRMGKAFPQLAHVTCNLEAIDKYLWDEYAFFFAVLLPIFALLPLHITPTRNERHSLRPTRKT